MDTRSPELQAPHTARSRGAEARTGALEDLLIALSTTSGIGYGAACRLAADAIEGSATGATGASALTPAAIGDLEPHAARLGVSAVRLRRAREISKRSGSLAALAREAAQELGARPVTRLSAEYPAALLDLELPPPVLWVRGNLPQTPCLSVVGPRNADRWALDVARSLSYDLAARGLTIVSGFARGVDATAHRAALDATGGRTVAVLGCGLGVPYPSQHHELTEPIAAAGAVISESPCGAPPAAWRFPVRNRIIAALGLGTVVIQASVRSGSLITARLALELGREVYAVPGRPSDRRSMGSNLLLRDGAHVVLDASSVLDTLPTSVLDRLGAGQQERTGGADGPCDDSAPTGPIAARVLDALEAGGTAVEELARRLDLGIEELLGVLLELELEGRVRKLSRREYGPALRPRRREGR